jgi:predicted kinase
MTPFLTLMVGPPGSGKSTHALRQWSADDIVSTDQLRALICGDPYNQDVTAEAFALLHTNVRSRLAGGLTTIVDATNSHARHRAILLDIARDTGAFPVAVVMSTPLEVCLARNAARPGPAPGRLYGPRVPEDEIKDQHERIQADLTGLHREGFTGIEQTARQP